MGLGQKNSGLQVLACLKKADVFISNNKTIEVFIDNLEKIFKKNI